MAEIVTGAVVLYAIYCISCLGCLLLGRWAGMLDERAKHDGSARRAQPVVMQPLQVVDADEFRRSQKALWEKV